MTNLTRLITRLGLLSVLTLGFHFYLFAQSSVKEQRSVGSFSAINAGGAFNIELVQGDGPMVSVEGEKDVLDHLHTEVKGNTLHIEMRGYQKNMKTKVNVIITFTDMESVALAGASNLNSRGTLNLNRINLDVSGASNLNLALNASELTGEFHGAANVQLTGTVKNQEVELDGAVNYKAGDLESSDTHIKASGAASAKINVSNRLEAKASGASNIRYSGNPSNVNADSSGAGSVEKI